MEAITKLKNIKPKDVGINLYFTCDETSKLEQVYLELHPDANLGDSGSSSNKQNEKKHKRNLTGITEDSNENKIPSTESHLRETEFEIEPLSPSPIPSLEP
jgi:hypothetical protein